MGTEKANSTSDHPTENKDMQPTCWSPGGPGAFALPYTLTLPIPPGDSSHLWGSCGSLP